MRRVAKQSRVGVSSAHSVRVKELAHVMTLLRRAAMACMTCLTYGCAEAPITTGTIDPPNSETRAQAYQGRLKPTHVGEAKKPPEINREWCELRQRDIRAGRPPLGEADPNRIAVGDALCMRWFGSQTKPSIN